MKKYIKNKNFVPIEFYNLKVKKELESINKMKFLFIILNFILLPVTVKNLYLYRENKANCIDNLVNYEYKVQEKDIAYDNIVNWFDNIFLDQVEGAMIDKNSGEITISNMNVLKKLSDKINIKNINNDNTNYILGVELENEEK